MQGKLILGRYRVERKIGEGGMGEVFLARHTMLSMPVVVKVVRQPHQALLARFEREAMTMARVQHVNVVRVLDFGVEEGLPVLVMEFIDGESMAERLDLMRVLPWPYAFEIAAQVLDGLAAIHAAGIVHRDVKPENIMLGAGRPEIAKILDFGIVRDNTEGQRKLTATGLTVGTPAYMAPEQLAGTEVGPACDIYALATTVWEAIAGRLPFGGEVEDLSRKLTAAPTEPVPPNSQMPAPTQAANEALLSMMAPAVKDRASEPTRCADALRQAVAQFRSSTPAPTVRSGTRLSSPVPPPNVISRAATGGVEPRPPRLADTVAKGDQRAAARPPRGALDVAGPTQYAAKPVDKLGPLVVAARLPSRALTDANERRWLATRFGAGARSFTLGDGFLIVVEPRATADDLRDRDRVHALGRELRERFGATVRIAGRHASSSFALSAAALTGAAPLPGVVQSLLTRLAD